MKVCGEFNVRDEYKRSIIVTHKTLKFVIQCNMFQLNEQSTGIMHREEKPIRCHWMVYCSYNMLNMFRALLCPLSGARDYMCVIAVYGVQWLVAGCRVSCAEQKAMRPERGMLHDSSSLRICNDARTNTHQVQQALLYNNAKKQN